MALNVSFHPDDDDLWSVPVVESFDGFTPRVERKSVLFDLDWSFLKNLENGIIQCSHAMCRRWPR